MTPTVNWCSLILDLKTLKTFDYEFNFTNIERGFNLNLSKRLARIILMLDKNKSLNKSESVTKEMVRFLCSASGILNNRIFFSLEILFIIW